MPFCQAVAPLRNARVLLQFDETMRPGTILVQQIHQDVDASVQRGLVLKLGNAPCFTPRYVATAQRNKEYTEVTSVQPVLGEFLRLVGLRRPVFHRVNGDPSLAQVPDDIGAVILQILESRRHEGFEGS